MRKLLAGIGAAVLLATPTYAGSIAAMMLLKNQGMTTGSVVQSPVPTNPYSPYSGLSNTLNQGGSYSNVGGTSTSVSNTLANTNPQSWTPTYVSNSPSPTPSATFDGSLYANRSARMAAYRAWLASTSTAPPPITTTNTSNPINVLSTPEPSSYLFMAGGLAALFTLQRRRAGKH